MKEHGIPPAIAGVVRHVHEITSNSRRCDGNYFTLPHIREPCMCLKSHLLTWAQENEVTIDLDLAVEADPRVRVGGFEPFVWILLCDEEPHETGAVEAKPLLLPPPLLLPTPPTSLPPSPPTSRGSSSPLSSPTSSWRSPPPTDSSSSAMMRASGAADSVKMLKCFDALELLDPSTTSVGLVAASDDLCCPITLEPFNDPVVAEDGFTYEREAISVWIRKTGTSPSTGATMGSSTVPNKLLRRIIKAQLPPQGQTTGDDAI